METGIIYLFIFLFIYLFIFAFFETLMFSSISFLSICLRGVDTLSRETTLSKLCLLPSEKGSFPKGKNLLPIVANSFLLE